MIIICVIILFVSGCFVGCNNNSSIEDEKNIIIINVMK